MSVHRSLVLLAAVTALLVFAAPAWAGVITVTADGVDPDPLTVEVGEPVEFVNDGDDEVRFFDDTELWDSGPLGPGESFSIAFDEPGRITYTSDDGELAGAIIVADPEGDAEGMPETGAPVALIAGIAVLALLTGAFALRRS